MAYIKYCNHIGCKQLVPQGVNYCARHTRDGSTRHLEYDKTARNKDATAFYHSRAWQLARQKALLRDGGLDIFLLMTEGRIEEANTVHHIVELSEDKALALDQDNLISLSDATHSTVSRIYKDDAGRHRLQKQLRELLKAYKENYRR